MSRLPPLLLLLLLAAADLAGQVVHPRLFFDPADIAGLQAKVATEPYAAMLAQIRRNQQRGGNFATTYLLTGDETWAEMAAYRALDYISNTERWGTWGQVWGHGDR